MHDSGTAVLEPSAEADDRFSFEAADVTGTHEVVVNDVRRGLPAGTVARALAARLALPQNVPWSLHDSQGGFLDESRAIGDQIDPGSRVTVAPKTHLG